MVVLETAIATVGAGAGLGSLISGVVAHRESRKARKAPQGGPLNIGSELGLRGWVKKGTEQVYMDSMGNISAVGFGPNDFSMGYFQTGTSSKQTRAAAAHAAA